MVPHSSDTTYSINLLIGISADGVYQAKGFGEVVAKDVSDDSMYVKQVSWDASHWMNLAVTDVKDGKIGTSKEFFQSFVERTNTFADVLNRGKGP